MNNSSVLSNNIKQNFQQNWPVVSVFWPFDLCLENKKRWYFQQNSIGSSGLLYIVSNVTHKIDIGFGNNSHQYSFLSLGIVNGSNYPSKCHWICLQIFKPHNQLGTDCIRYTSGQLYKGRELCSCRRKLICKRLWVRTPVPETGLTFFP